MPLLRLPAVVFAVLLAGASHAGAAPKVAVSILPIHSLVAGVMTGIAEPALIVKGGASPHFYSLRPSDAQALDSADIVFWIGPTMESFLVKPLESLADDAVTVELLEADTILRLESREGGAWAEHDAHEGDADGEHGEAASDDTAGGHDETEPHIWLDSENARRIVRIAVQSLSAADPENAARYVANGKGMETRLDELEAEVTAMLIPVVDTPYVVFHDAYRYFEDRFGTRAIGSIVVGDGRKPGARRLEEIRVKIVELEARCVFAEPQFEPALVRTVIEGTGARAGILDPLGAELAPGPDAYFDLMRNLGRALRDCLGRTD
jgi:zinc transport system substrate-binding protein